MDKKNYVKPSMEVYEMEMTPLICISSPGGGGKTYLPGQAEDEKHLA